MKRSETSIVAALKNDTAPGGGRNSDAITSDPTIAGSVVPRERVRELKARFHGARSFADITALVQSSGDFLIDVRELERIRGDRLEDGPYALRLEALDQYGTALASTDIAFTLDTTPPQPILFEPRDGGLSNLQLGFIDVAIVDESDIDPRSVTPDNILIRNGDRTLSVVRAEPTSDGLFRYYYEGKLRDGPVHVVFIQEQISDIAGNFNTEQHGSFEFLSTRPTFNGIPQRPRRLQVEPIINPPYNEDSGASVYLHSGEAFLRRVDLAIPGRGVDFRFERTYRSAWISLPLGVPHTPLGHKWDFNYNRRLKVVSRGNVVRMDGRGREDLYRSTPEAVKGQEPYVPPSGSYTTLMREGGGFVERDRHGNEITYTLQPLLGTYQMTTFQDRNGNTIRYEYVEGQLSYVIDTLGRRIEFVYNDKLLTTVRDFAGREVTFTYDPKQRLETVRGPRVVGTPHGNDFPKGKTEKYSYHDGANNVFLTHNLLTVTAPNETARGGPPREIYVYNNDGRVIRHTYGGTNNSGVPAGGTFQYSYMYQPPLISSASLGAPAQPAPVADGPSEALPTERPMGLVSGPVQPFLGEDLLASPPKTPTTSVTDRSRNRTSYEFNPLGNWTQIREATNRDVRPFDPHFYVEHHRFDKDGQRLTVTHHERNRDEYALDALNSDPLQRGNLLQVRRRPDSARGADQAEIVTNYTYEPIYNQRRTVTDPRGNTTTYIFDYQEGTDYAGLARAKGIEAQQVKKLLEDAGIPMGLGDVNGDGRTDQIAGNVVRIEHPTVNLWPDSHQAKIEGTTNQEIVDLFTYNAFGQLIRQTDPEGNVTSYAYYSERDPNGDAIMDGNPLGSPLTGGYLRQVTRDVSGHPDRNSGTDPPSAGIRTTYLYDQVGNVIRQVNARGIATDYVVNELNQVVQVVRDAARMPAFLDELVVGGVVGGTSSVVMAAPASGPSSTFKYIERFWYDFNNNLVLHQKEDRGNTSTVKGNPQGFQDLPIHAVAIDFESAVEASCEAYTEKGFVLTPRHGSSGGTAVIPRERLEFVTVRGERGLRLSSRSSNDGVELRTEDGTPFSLESVRILHSVGGDGQWVVVSPADGREILGEPGTALFSGAAWTNIVSIGLFPVGDPGDLVLGEWGVYPNPDPTGGNTAFADTVYRYDILDNRIETIQEVQNGTSPHFLRTRYRYDANENLALTIFPEGNASTVVYDERDLRFRQGHGERTPETSSIEVGAVTAVTVPSTGMVNAAASWTANEWEGHFVRITGGKGKGQFRRIVSNTRTVLTVSPAWDDPPDATSTYVIGMTFALLHPKDPIDYDVRGGLSCSCASYAYDGSRNMVEMVGASDTDLSPDNNNPQLGPGDRTRYVYDGFDRLIKTIDSVGNQTAYGYDAASNRVREQHYGPTDGPSPTSDEPSTNLLASTTYRYDELNRQSQIDQDLFVNTTPTTREADVADGATDLGKGDLTPGDKGVSRRFEYDRKSRRTFTVQDDGDTFRTFYDGVHRVIKTVDPEGNTVESTYDNNHNLTELRQIEISQETTSGAGTVQSGQSTGSNGVRTLNDTTQSWRRFEWAGRTLRITGGRGAGQARRIIANISDQLTVDQDWDVVPDDTSSYAILVLSLLDSGLSTGFSTAEVLNDATKTWAVGEWAGRTVEITDGTGAGQVRKITSNNPFQLFVDPAWDVIADDTSRYAIYPRPQPGIAEVFLTTYFYDSLDRIERQIDNLGQATYYRYDSRDNLVAMADAQGPTGGTITRRAFSNGPLTVNSINAFGNATLYHYDGINRQTRREVLLTASGSGDGVHIGATMEGIKTKAGAPESHPPDLDTTQGGGDGIIRIGTLYDNNSLISAHIDDQGNVTLYLYDNLDRRLTETKGLTTGTGPLTKALILGGREIPAPDMATIDDPAVIPAAKINTQLAAARARIEAVASLFPSVADQIKDPTTTVYGYDPGSNLLILEDENCSTLFIRYDAINRPIAVRVFRAGQADNHAGDPVFAPNPVRAPVSPANTSRPVVGTTKQDFQFDGLSRLVMATDNNDPADGSNRSLVTFAYDSLGRVIEEQQQIGALTPKVISTSWRADNLRSTLTFPNGRVSKYTYDPLDRIKTIADNEGAKTLVQYNYIGPARVLERLYPINGTRLTHLDDAGSNDIGYDGLQRPTALRHLRTDNLLVVGFAHAYDRANNKLTEERLHAAGDSELYRYDSPNRLVQFERGTLNAPKDAIDAPSSNVPEQSRWELDGAGNWTAVDSESREHSSVNEITSRNAGGTIVTLTYDDNGNLTDDGSKAFEWDAYDRLRTVQRNSDEQIIAKYVYDALGRRISKIVTNSGPLDGRIFYYHDGQRVIEEHDEAELLRHQYVHGNYIDEVLVMDRNLDGDNSATGVHDQRIFYHQSSLMHPYAVTDITGRTVEGYLYDAYGQHAIYKPGATGFVTFGGDDTVVSDEPSSVANPYLFTGRRFDPETGLLYYRARYFNPVLGRFITRDPLGVWTNMNNLGNGYGYVGNNPVMWLDPFGLDRAGEWEYSWGEAYFDENGNVCRDFYGFRESDGVIELKHFTGVKRCRKLLPDENPDGNIEVTLPLLGDPVPLPPIPQKKEGDTTSREEARRRSCEICLDHATQKANDEYDACMSFWETGKAAAEGGGIGALIGVSVGGSVGCVIGGVKGAALLGAGALPGCGVGAKVGAKLGVGIGTAVGALFGGGRHLVSECDGRKLAKLVEENAQCRRHECAGN